MSILALTSDTLVGTAASGQIEYDGQFFGTDSNASRAQLQRIVRATAVASTSGTSIDFTGIPAWVERITVMLSGVSTNGTSFFLAQIGSGSVVTTGYVGAVGTNAGTTNSFSTGFTVYNNTAAADSFVGTVVLTLIGSNTWIESGVIYSQSSTRAGATSAGSLTLGGTLDRVRITTVNGTDTFDAGTINIIYEG
jgi:hypothetical protein